MKLSKDPQPSMYADKMFAQKLRRRKGQMWRQMCVRVRVRVVRFFICVCIGVFVLNVFLEHGLVVQKEWLSNHADMEKRARVSTGCLLQGVLTYTITSPLGFLGRKRLIMVIHEI